jgi:cytochrome c1
VWGERIALALVAALFVASVGYALHYFDAELPDPRGQAEAMTGGSAAAGRSALSAYGCTACHRVQGIREARGVVGPPLRQFQQKLFIAGSMPNDVDTLVEWIQHPTKLRPGTAMPETGIDEAGARDIAAYLYAQQ